MRTCAKKNGANVQEEKKEEAIALHKGQKTWVPRGPYMSVGPNKELDNNNKIFNQICHDKIFGIGHLTERWFFTKGKTKYK